MKSGCAAHPKEPHWHLAFLGVDPTQALQGYDEIGVSGHAARLRHELGS